MAPAGPDAIAVLPELISRLRTGAPGPGAASRLRASDPDTGPTEETTTMSAQAQAMDEQTAATVIAGARDRIDDLDGRIIELIQERIGVSAEVQQARMASGGRRLSLNRGMEILTRYSDALGRPGTTLAMTLLELCRGRI
jgi:chorismate mutase